MIEPRLHPSRRSRIARGSFMRVVVPLIAIASLALPGIVARTSAAPWADNAFASASASSLHWDWVNSSFQFRGAFSKCLDVESRFNTPGASVRLWTCNHTPAQRWTVRSDKSISAYSTGFPASSGTISPLTTPVCLAVTNGNDGATTQIAACSAANGVATANQRWYIVDNGDGTATVRNQQGAQSGDTDLCLGTAAAAGGDPTALNMRACGKLGVQQAWTLQGYGTPPFTQV